MRSSKSRSSQVTIKDIASLLRMSHSTVSRALNDRSHIRSETRDRVRAAADQLGYVANLSARMIRGDVGMLVGLVIPDIRNDFYNCFAKEFAERCRRVGRRMLLAITEDDPETEKNELRALAEARVSGIVATLTSDPLPTSIALLRDLPSVQLVRRIPQLSKAAVCMHDMKACKHATEHLISLGHRRIAYVGTSKSISTGNDRFRGFLNAHKLRGLDAAAELIELIPPRQAYGYEGTKRVLSASRRPSALLIGSSELTIGALQAVQDVGLKIPYDMSVVGYGDPMWFEILSPQLTAIRLPVNELADAAAEDLFGQIDNPNTTLSKQVKRVFPQFIPRGSTAAIRT